MSARVPPAASQRCQRRPSATAAEPPSAAPSTAVSTLPTAAVPDTAGWRVNTGDARNRAVIVVSVWVDDDVRERSAVRQQPSKTNVRPAASCTCAVAMLASDPRMTVVLSGVGPVTRLATAERPGRVREDAQDDRLRFQTPSSACP